MSPRIRIEIPKLKSFKTAVSEFQFLIYKKKYFPCFACKVELKIPLSVLLNGSNFNDFNEKVVSLVFLKILVLLV